MTPYGRAKVGYGPGQDMELAAKYAAAQSEPQLCGDVALCAQIVEQTTNYLSATLGSLRRSLDRVLGPEPQAGATAQLEPVPTGKMPSMEFLRVACERLQNAAEHLEREVARLDKL